MVKHCWKRHVCGIFKKDKKRAVLCQMENTWLNKTQVSSLQGELPMQHFAIAACCSLSSSKKAHALYNSNRTTQDKEKLITVILQAEKEGSLTFTFTLYFSLLL